MARILGIDFGERRVGLAISDPGGIIARPLPTLTRRRGQRPPVGPILELARTHEVERFVIGLPLSLEGKETEWTAQVRAVGEAIARLSGRPVDFMDERFTSVAAERIVRSLGLSKRERERKERIDATSAALILQSYLDRRQRGTDQVE